MSSRKLPTRYAGCADIAYPVIEDPEGDLVEFDDYAALLAEHEALLRRVAEAPVALMGMDCVLYGESTPLAALHNQRVRILAEPGEVGS